MDAAAYVLQTFPKDERDLLPEYLSRAAEALDCYLEFGLDTSMNRFNPKNKEADA
jgi:peptidyl-tRNA hydrolase